MTSRTRRHPRRRTIRTAADAVRTGGRTAKSCFFMQVEGNARQFSTPRPFFSVRSRHKLAWPHVADRSAPPSRALALDPTGRTDVRYVCVRVDLGVARTHRHRQGRTSFAARVVLRHGKPLLERQLTRRGRRDCTAAAAEHPRVGSADVPCPRSPTRVLTAARATQRTATTTPARGATAHSHGNGADTATATGIGGAELRSLARRTASRE